MCCMMIYHPENARPFSRTEFADFWTKNRNGFGAIWRAPSGEIRWRKGLDGRADAWKLYQSLLANGCREMALHWRLSTSGPINWENCHPFEVTDDILLMHNGVLSHRSTKTHSDTRCYIDDKLNRPLSRRPFL